MKTKKKRLSDVILERPDRETIRDFGTVWAKPVVRIMLGTKKYPNYKAEHVWKKPLATLRIRVTALGSMMGWCVSPMLMRHMERAGLKVPLKKVCQATCDRLLREYLAGATVALAEQRGRRLPKKHPLQLDSAWEKALDVKDLTDMVRQIDAEWVAVEKKASK